jgi:tetraacyldisaccharide 4'-kinase
MVKNITEKKRKAFKEHPEMLYTFDIPVISIGNITAGGTGKTPAVSYVTNIAESLGLKTAIVSRGYKKSAEAIHNDEQLLMSIKHDKAIIKSAALRKDGIEEAIKEGAQVAILDDGFQHLSVRRNLNIVLIDANCPFGGHRVMPRGLLRESLDALEDADAFIITKCESVAENKLKDIKNELKKYNANAPVAHSIHAPAAVYNLKWQLADSIEGKKAYAFSSVARPEHFHFTLEQMKCNIVGTSEFEDHHLYSDSEICKIVSEAKKYGAEVIVTTEKDAIKLVKYAESDFFGIPTVSVGIELSIFENEETIKELIKSALNNNSKREE